MLPALEKTRLDDANFVCVRATFNFGRVMEQGNFHPKFDATVETVIYQLIKPWYWQMRSRLLVYPTIEASGLSINHLMSEGSMLVVESGASLCHAAAAPATRCHDSRPTIALAGANICLPRGHQQRRAHTITFRECPTRSHQIQKQTSTWRRRNGVRWGVPATLG